MEFKKNIQGIAIGITGCSLLVISIIGWCCSGFGGGRFLLTLACCVLGIMSLIWFGKCWLGTVWEINSITNLLNQNMLPRVKRKNNVIISELNRAIKNRFSRDANCIEELQKQTSNMQINMQLLRKQKRNTEAIIYSIRDAVVVVDEFDKVLMANEAAGNLFDFDFKNCQYKPIDKLIGEDKFGFVEFLRSSRKNEVRHTRHELEFVGEQSVNTFDCIVSCVYDESEKVCGVVAVLHDVTREKEVSQMKNDFVSHVSHELKTPLASITAYSEMLVDGEANDEEMRKEFYSIIQSQAARLNRLIEDILNISRIESGLIKIEKKPISLALLINEQTQMIKSYAEEKNIEIVEPKLIVCDQVSADKDMISQVIVNLLSNAIKYTPSGGTVKISAEVNDISRLVKVTVTDTGIGIPKEEVEHVFDKFYRVGANKKYAKGTGLGLNLVKQIVEKVHDGKVFVISKVGAGSTFGFELPLATLELVGTA